MFRMSPVRPQRAELLVSKRPETSRRLDLPSFQREELPMQYPELSESTRMQHLSNNDSKTCCILMPSIRRELVVGRPGVNPPPESHQGPTISTVPLSDPSLDPVDTDPIFLNSPPPSVHPEPSHDSTIPIRPFQTTTSPVTLPTNPNTNHAQSPTNPPLPHKSIKPMDPPIFDNDIQFHHDHTIPIQTSAMTFHWPVGSSPTLTKQFTHQAGGTLSSLNHDAFQHYLKDHPDQPLVQNFLRGLQEGFPVGYKGPSASYEPPPRTYSDQEFHDIRSEFLAEVALGRMAGPFTSLPTTGPYSNFQRINPTFLIPKRDSNKMRRIEHLSFPPGNSVNDHICNHDFPVDFTSIDRISHQIQNSPRGSFVSCVDIESAYRHIPIHPVDAPLFCFRIRDEYYIQLRAGFGCTSLPGIFDTATHLVSYIILHHSKIDQYPDSGFTHVEALLDDYSCWHSERAMHDEHLLNLEHQRLLQIFHEIGFPLATHKIQPPATTFTAMGATFNTIDQSVSIPPEKLQRYLLKINSIFPPNFSYDNTTHIRARIKTIRSICGALVYVCSICYTGRTRLYYLFQCLRAAENRAYSVLGNSARSLKRFPGMLDFVHLNLEAIHDLRWWQSILPSLPPCLILRRRIQPRDLSSIPTFYTDASGWGIGGWTKASDGEHYYFSIPWSRNGKGCHSTYGELFACVVAAHLWDHNWKYQQVRWMTDCEAHVTGLFRIRTKAPRLLPLHDQIDLRSALGCYQYSPDHIAGVDNTIADELSRGIIEVPTHWIRCRLGTDCLPTHFGTKLVY